ncbi:hypothetical protein FVEN_g2139 [Fusarium venenatum]|uniref:2EXR domain-containing protein n=1 Tax=Fusarium venenatum TaxID=56646 RepID=A0A2L2SS16_9HYPO|nr:uncharacterized protein FVRRES_12552 [Fusarium venenatum]KAG8360391.1 hypothetical protein FVEN_g2139 [Fusarium venenatum]KAH6979162.1 hypothetical protein EDB82DRAFT_477880 [Fusarium venenatum]CEI39861.1 unnamed protein product [Fusarium venenatum]
MATASFHSFPLLPTELQLQIWEEACITLQPQQQRIHYVDIEAHPQRPLLLAFHPGFGNDPFGSACLINHGLRGASRDSRIAIIQHNNAARSHARTEMKIKGIDGGSGGYCLVDPSRDIFCIRARSWNVDKDLFKVQEMGISDSQLGGLINFRIVKNIAFEFDPTWLINLPNEVDLMAESSPRGLFSRPVQNRYRFNPTAPNIWLIDRETRRSRRQCSYCHVPSAPYIDYTEEYYVEGKSDALCVMLESDERSQALPLFLKSLKDRVYWSEATCNIDHVRFIFRRGRQVDLCDRDGHPKHEHGWDIIHQLYDQRQNNDLDVKPWSLPTSNDVPIHFVKAKIVNLIMFY